MEKLNFKNGKVTVAVGEGAGKRHEVLEVKGIKAFKTNRGVLIRTKNEPTKITHPRHGIIEFPKNDEMEFIIQEEYNDIGEYRKVKD